MQKRALITGITGQDGSYMAEYLLDLGYEVHGLVRRVASSDQDERLGRLLGVLDRITLHPSDICDYSSVLSVFSRHEFDECYHFAAQSNVPESFKDPFSTLSTNIQGTQHVLQAIKDHQPRCRMYFAASSEMFGNSPDRPQSEATVLAPCSPYAVSKVAGFHLVRNYRESYGLHCCSGIVFNHESPRRGVEFVTRKITTGAAKIKLGLQSVLELGNLDSKRDWGHAADYVEGMYKMVNAEKVDDYVLATGETHSVREFCEHAFGQLGLDYRDHVRVAASLTRPLDVNYLVGDYSKAEKELGWKPRRKFKELVEEMAAADLELWQERAKQGAQPVRA